MKVTHVMQDGKLSFEFEAENIMGAFKQLSILQEVFGEDTCLKCGSKDLRYTVRKSTYKDEKGREKDCDYHELRCKKCSAKLTFGVLDDGSFNLFPKRKDKDGSWLGSKTVDGKTVPTYGWVKWNFDTGKEE
jgi:hypothetical protein